MNKIKPTEQAYTAKEYAEDVCFGKVTHYTVRNWIKKWLSKGGLPARHRLEILPNGRVVIVVSEESSNNTLLNHLVANR
ncbi:hypothetical protein [Pseudoalteromonas aurantia]|uniref:Helix-turn-helix domain-containing protein n=1 Tax=Pseudoalteromonas aurantia TaxID=43654 RepID=A0ABY2VYP7_9GAMM|nr:hypothetical protein [Pseudoalteromonas aurantia]TMO75309.1 hypothetical protein CWC20_08285 [Pseudoalteromonas aurantia]